MHLAQHLKEVGSSQSAFGSELDPPVSQGLVGQWIRGVTRITLHYALQIEEKTGRAVTCEDCKNMFVDPSKRVA